MKKVVLLENWFLVLLCCVFVLGVHRLYGQTSLPLDSSHGLVFDDRLCVTAKESQEAKILESHIVAYYSTVRNEITGASVLLMCDYNEKGMPKKDYPSMSTRTLQRVLATLDKRQPFGPIKKGRVAAVNAGFVRRVSHYTRATVSWDEFTCDAQKSPDFGCGVFRIDVKYR